MLTNKSGRLVPTLNKHEDVGQYVAQIQYIICEYTMLPATLQVPWIWFIILTE